MLLRLSTWKLAGRPVEELRILPGVVPADIDLEAAADIAGLGEGLRNRDFDHNLLAGVHTAAVADYNLPVAGNHHKIADYSLPVADSHPVGTLHMLLVETK